MPTYTGTSGNDYLPGSAGADSIYGLGGHDTLMGYAGADYMDGGTGNDTLLDNDGQTPDTSIDTLIGGDGDDWIYAGFGDAVLGGNNWDTLIYRMDYASTGVIIDWTNLWLGYTYSVGGRNISGMEHIQWVVGTQYDDEMMLGTPTGRTSEMAGGGGSDILWGGAGNDILNADFFYSLAVVNDTVGDYLDGLDGNDYLTGGLGDIFVGGNGNDKIVLDCGMSGTGVNLDFNTLIASGTDIIGTAEFYQIEHVFGVLGSLYNDTLNAGTETGDMSMRGRAGDDSLQTGYGNDTLDGGTGADAMAGGLGNDSYTIDNAGDTITEYSSGGTDNVSASVTFTLGSEVEHLSLTGSANIDGTGNGVVNTISGNSGNNALSGLAGDDTLNGNNGSDLLTGGAGKDVMAGGSGADQFLFDDGDFAGLLWGTADQIADFSHAAGDLIGLSAVDAVAGGGDDAFTYLGTGAFTGVAGQLRYAWVGSFTMVYGDTNGDSVTDLAIMLNGNISLVAGDFVL